MSKPTLYTDVRLFPTAVITKSRRARVAALAIGGGGTAPVESPVSVWDGTAWVPLPGPPTP